MVHLCLLSLCSEGKNNSGRLSLPLHKHLLVEVSCSLAKVIVSMKKLNDSIMWLSKASLVAILI
jgi:hypothetical protein